MKLHQRGDTIVEVLIALAILSLAFVISYSTANSALIDSQNSQEHSMALEYLDTQAELLRYAASQVSQGIIPASEFSPGGNAFCLSVPLTLGGIATAQNVNYVPFGNTLPKFQYQPSIKTSDYPAQCQVGSGFNYYLAIQPGPQANDFQIWLWWYGLGSLGVQQERISYRVYQ